MDSDVEMEWEEMKQDLTKELAEERRRKLSRPPTPELLVDRETYDELRLEYLKGDDVDPLTEDIMKMLQISYLEVKTAERRRIELEAAVDEEETKRVMRPLTPELLIPREKYNMIRDVILSWNSITPPTEQYMRMAQLEYIEHQKEYRIEEELREARERKEGENVPPPTIRPGTPFPTMTTPPNLPPRPPPRDISPARPRTPLTTIDPSIISMPTQNQPSVPSPLRQHSPIVANMQEPVAVYYTDPGSPESNQSRSTSPYTQNPAEYAVETPASPINESEPDDSYKSMDIQILTDITLADAWDIVDESIPTDFSSVRNSNHSATSLVPTEPDVHPTPKGLIGRLFLQPRRVSKTSLLRHLELDEIELNRILDSEQDLKEDRLNYLERLTETIDRIRELKAEVIGEPFDANQIFLRGLINILDIFEGNERNERSNSPSPSLEYPDESMITRPRDGDEETEINDNMIGGTELTRLDAQGPNPDISTQTQTHTSALIHHSALIPRCPTQPNQDQTDPRDVPIEERLWSKGGAITWARKAGRQKGVVLVDTRTLMIITGPTDHLPLRHVKQFTELDDDLRPLIFPGRITHTSNTPCDIPPTTARTFLDRIRELRLARREVENVYHSAHRMYPNPELNNCLRTYITLYKRIHEGSTQLCPVKVDRLYFWQRLHPVWNPLVKPIEAAFLQGVSYLLRSEGQPERARDIEKLLQTPHYDDWEVRELVGMGALDSDFREDEALQYFEIIDDEHWDFHESEQSFLEAPMDTTDDTEDSTTPKA